ncbi:MAG: CHASE2 domain-containing protein [Candidatus Tectomicrobia bacterium]|uniref:CHASE2 domain-containing protein n=1 Tax=Tectimicrobiota bacterium TaxID=2528274 RepID=A0A932CMJ5_UNCTE|nr:CHASE2 domain-containing protein [Candidatus Tectomicrobia bacterium]
MGEIEDALAAYRRAVYTLQSIRQEISLGPGSDPATFRKSVGSAYLELVDLLLQRAASMRERARYEPYLEEARKAVESLKVAELRDYFRDDCVDAARRETPLDLVSQTAVVIYPILLPDRTELLVSLPKDRTTLESLPDAEKLYELKRFTVPVGADALTQEVRKFREKLERRSTLEYLPHAQRLYDWLIRPLEPDLASLTIDTLVFVPDGPLRTIPLAALHDGRQFLIGRYALATTPGLDLTDPRPLPRESARVLAAGLTEAVQGFPPLPFVAAEFQEIGHRYGGRHRQLLDRDFLVSRTEKELREGQFTVVHLASHAQFGHNIQDTFILTFDDKLAMDRLARFVGLFRFREDPLELLTRYRPRAIGLDLIRDLPVPPGRERLEAVLAGNRRIIAVMKFGNGVEMGIPPPPALKGTDRVGFGDVMVDPGGIVRRGLLFLDDGKTTAYAFALRLALVYLQAEGIVPQPDGADPRLLRLGRTTLRPFAPNDGGYVGADAGGYQFLLDFKEAPGSFPAFPLAALLAGQVDPKGIEGRIVLLGVVAESVKDYFYTPYSRGLQAGQRISGIALHAHIISQLLRSGLESAAPVATAGEWAEGLWILLWSVIGGAMGLWVQPAWRVSLRSAGVLLALGLAAYGAFRGGWWIPSVPAALAWGGSTLVVTAYTANRERVWVKILKERIAAAFREVAVHVPWIGWRFEQKTRHKG